MALPEVVTDDVQARYEGDLLTEFSTIYISTQLQDAVDFVGNRWRALIESRLASGILTPNLYKRTIADAVLRVIRNPGGLASENEGGYGYATRPDVASGNLWFTDTDVETLTGIRGYSQSSGSLPGTIGVGLGAGWL
jgi:hypothetical protein